MCKCLLKFVKKLGLSDCTLGFLILRTHLNTFFSSPENAEKFISIFLIRTNKKRNWLPKLCKHYFVLMKIAIVLGTHKLKTDLRPKKHRTLGLGVDTVLDEKKRLSTRNFCFHVIRRRDSKSFYLRLFLIRVSITLIQAYTYAPCSLKYLIL